MRGTSSCFTAQLPCSTNATSRPQSRQPRCQSSLKPVLPSWPSQLSLSHDQADWRCFTAALDREVISAEAPTEFVNRKTFPAPAAAVLQDNATLFVEEHRIRAYEVGADQKTTISTIANLLQVLICSLARVTCSESACCIMTCELGYRK